MGNICVIGPKGSGKTTYLAALAYLPNTKGINHRKNNYKIQPQNPESLNLAEKAEDIICQGLELDKTRIGQEFGLKTVDDLPFYAFRLEIKKNLLGKSESIDLTARDYPGEVFEEIVEPRGANSIHQAFIEECFTDVVGCLILLTGWERGTDSFYSRVMKKFIGLMDTYERSDNFKLAVTMSKSERGEIWAGRLDPEIDLFGVHLPRTKQVLRENIPAKNLRFFAISTFGVLGRNDPRPNRIDRIVKGEPASVLREPQLWQPYNLIEPLYWLNKK